MARPIETFSCGNRKIEIFLRGGKRWAREYENGEMVAEGRIWDQSDFEEMISWLKGNKVGLEKLREVLP